MKTSNQDHDVTTSSTTKKNTSSRQKRVLVASIILAAVITIGGTFAWFTSEDTVTNKLTASSDYGVSVVESFKTPKNLIPGQAVEKKVGVTNTGTIDAFAKVSLSNFITITNDTDGIAIPTTTPKRGSVPTSTTDDEQEDGVTYNLVTLSTKAVDANLPDTEAQSADEVKSVQAGGRLIFGRIVSGDSAIGKVVSPQNDTLQGTEYKPKYTGLYIFERLISVNESDNTYEYEYDGYFFIRDDKDDTQGAGVYYAVNIPADAISRDANGNVTKVNISEENASNVTLKRTKTITNADLTFEEDIKSNYTADGTATAPYYIIAKYCPEPDDDSEEEDNSEEGGEEADDTTSTHDHATDLLIRINLTDTYTDNVSTNWTYIAQTDPETEKIVPTFYLNEILQSGGTSKNVIDSVEIDPSVVKEAYKNFDYNLNVKAESVQVVYNSDGSTVNLLASSKKGSSASAVNDEWQDSFVKLYIATNKTGDETTASQNAISTVTLNWTAVTDTGSNSDDTGSGNGNNEEEQK